MQIFKHSHSLAGLSLVTLMLLATPALAQQSHKWGTIGDITSVEGAILIRLDSGLPDNCTGSPWGWMIIPRKSKEIQATLMMFYAMGKRSGTVYTSGRPDGGYCEINQWDPAE